MMASLRLAASHPSGRVQASVLALGTARTPLAPLLSRGTRAGRCGASLSSCRNPLPSEFIVGQAAAHGSFEHSHKASSVALVALVESEGFFVQVAEEVEGLNADVRPLEGALQEAPEVLNAVRVDLPFDVLLGMVDDAMDEVGLEAAVGAKRIAEHFGAGSDVLAHHGGERVAAAACDVLGPNDAVAVRAVALQKPHNGLFSSPARSGDLRGALAHGPAKEEKT